MKQERSDWESFFGANEEPRPSRTAKRTARPVKPKPADKFSPKQPLTPAGHRRPHKTKPKTPLKTAQPITLSKQDRRDQLKAVACFFAEVKPGPTPIYIGIDPGATGAIGLIHPNDNRLSTVVDIPSMKAALKTKKKGKVQYRTVYDNSMIWEMFRIMLPFKKRLLVCLEKGSPRNTDTGLTGYSVGIGYGMWPLFFLSHGIKAIEVLPQVWKRKLNLLGSDKEVSRLHAQHAFPTAPLFNVGDHNRAESLLLATYLRDHWTSPS